MKLRQYGLIIFGVVTFITMATAAPIGKYMQALKAPLPSTQLNAYHLPFVLSTADINFENQSTPTSTVTSNITGSQSQFVLSINDDNSNVDDFGSLNNSTGSSALYVLVSKIAPLSSVSISANSFCTLSAVSSTTYQACIGHQLIGPPTTTQPYYIYVATQKFSTMTGFNSLVYIPCRTASFAGQGISLINRALSITQPGTYTLTIGDNQCSLQG